MRFYRTANYFRVKSRAAFQEFLQRNGCELLICEPGKVGFQGSEGAPLPQGRRLSEPERVLTFEEELSSHLREGEIAIVMEVTADLAVGVDEGWIDGRALAIDSHGATRTLDLQEIFTRLDGLDGQVTERMTG
jgi:hypothetical protein